MLRLFLAWLLLGTTLPLGGGGTQTALVYARAQREGTTRTCEPVDPMNAPEAHIHLVEAQRWPYKMVDVTEAGEVVQTTMIRYPSRWGDYSEMTWYRGKERCEVARRAAQQRAQERQQTIQRKYR